jgi:tellurite methyltransferase
MLSNPTEELKKEFGNIDIYVFDQLLKGRINHGQRILDAGCGGGRNIEYMLRQGFDVSGVDQDVEAIEKVQSLAESVAPSSTLDKFVLGDVAKMPFPDAHFDVVMSIAVLHFAKSQTHFNSMLGEMARVLKPGGVFMARLSSSVGIESLVEPFGDEVYGLPDGSTRFLVDDEQLLELTKSFPALLIDPIKTTVVQRMRSMTTWVIQKSI